MNIRALILAGVASVTLATAAQAAECNLGDNKIRLAASEFINVTSPAAVTASKVYADGNMSSVSGACTPEQFRAKFVELNGANNITPETILKIPVLLAVAPPTPVASASPAMVSKPIVQPIPAATASAVAAVSAPSPRLAAVRTQRTAAEKELRVVRASNDALPASLQGLAQGRITALEQKVAGLKALDERLTNAEAAITALQTSDVVQNKRLGVVEKGLSNVYTKPEVDKAVANVSGVSAWFWWLAVLGIPAALLLGLYSLVFKAGKSRVKKVEEEVETLQTAVSDIRDTLPADIKLDVFWYDEVLRLQTGEQAVLSVLVADGVGYNPKFTIRVEKISDDRVGILSGIQGHPALAEVTIANLNKTVRKAGFNNRLNEPFGLRAAA